MKLTRAGKGIVMFVLQVRPYLFPHMEMHQTCFHIKDDERIYDVCAKGVRELKHDFLIFRSGYHRRKKK